MKAAAAKPATDIPPGAKAIAPPRSYAEWEASFRRFAAVSSPAVRKAWDDYFAKLTDEQKADIDRTLKANWE